MKFGLVIITTIMIAGCANGVYEKTRFTKNTPVKKNEKVNRTEQPEVRSVLCGHNEIHAYRNGKLTVNGKEAKKTMDNGSYREYKIEGVKFSVTNEDISWSAKGGVHGICR